MENFIWVRERKVNGEAGEVAEYTVSAWTERLVELRRGYDLLISGIWTKQAVFLRKKEVMLKLSQRREKVKSKADHRIFCECCWGKSYRTIVGV